MPFWAKTACKQLIDLDMSKKELAAALDVNYVQLCNVLSGYVNNVAMMEKICTYLKI
jgi:DNA-binding Xre family transcriptional regulator